MRRGTTPTVAITVANDDGTPLDLTEHEFYVTFKERGASGAIVERTESDDGVEVDFDGTKSVVSVLLSQADTLRFHTGAKVLVQVRAKRAGVAIATDIDGFDAEEILKEGEI